MMLHATTQALGLMVLEKYFFVLFSLCKPRIVNHVTSLGNLLVAIFLDR